MPAEPMPYIQAEIRAQVALTSASEFKAKPDATAEAGIPCGRGWCGLWPQPRLGVGDMWHLQAQGDFFFLSLFFFFFFF